MSSTVHMKLIFLKYFQHKKKKTQEKYIMHI